MWFLWYNKHFFIHSLKRNISSSVLLKNDEISLTTFFEILSKFSTNQSVWDALAPTAPKPLQGMTLCTRNWKKASPTAKPILHVTSQWRLQANTSQPEPVLNQVDKLYLNGSRTLSGPHASGDRIKPFKYSKRNTRKPQQKRELNNEVFLHYCD